MTERASHALGRGDRRARARARRPDHPRLRRAEPRARAACSREASSSPPTSRAPSTCRCASTSWECGRTAQGPRSSGVVQITHDLSRPIEGEDVLLVEDIVDTGLTIAHLDRPAPDAGPASVRVCALLAQAGAGPHRRPRSTTSGFTIEDRFVVGYGLDFAERYRNLPYIGVIERTVTAVTSARAASRATCRARTPTRTSSARSSPRPWPARRATCTSRWASRPARASAATWSTSAPTGSRPEDTDAVARHRHREPRRSRAPRRAQGIRHVLLRRRGSAAFA